MHIHISHGGGTYICKQAQYHNEIVYKMKNCNLPGDGAGSSFSIMNCSVRADVLKNARRERKITFGASEHGFKDGEFCPHLYKYILYLRHPLKTLQSFISSHVNNTNNIDDIITIMKEPLLLESMNSTNELRTIPYYRYDNHVVRYLSNSTHTYYNKINTITNIEYNHAIQILNQFYFIFTDYNFIHHSKEITQMFKWKLKWKHILSSNNTISTTINSHGPNKVSSTQLDFFIKQNKYDLQLYEYVTNKFLQDYYMLDNLIHDRNTSSML
jgi:hypothetical protein